MNDLPTNPEIEIVIADDHPIFRRGLKAMIEVETDLKIVAEADDGAKAFAAIVEHEPDIAVLDLDMPEMDGFQIARLVQERNLATGIIFLTMHNSDSIFDTALELGVKGYVIKDSALPEIIDAIRAVRQGQNYISQPLAPLFRNRGNRTGYLENKAKLEDLSASERRILGLIAQGRTSRQIAEKLFISVRTVDRHRENICGKLDVRGSHALLKFAVEHKADLN